MQNLSYTPAPVRDIDISAPVFHSVPKNGSSPKTDRLLAEKWLLETLDNSRKTAEEKGWLTQEDVERKLGHWAED